MNKLLRLLFLLFGVFFFVVGVVAAFLPILPSFPFLLLSVVLVSKGSLRISQWIVSTKLYQNNVVAIKERKAMTLIAKLKLIAALTLVFGASFLMVPIWYLRVLLGLLWALHVTYFAFRIKTVKPIMPPVTIEIIKEKEHL